MFDEAKKVLGIIIVIFITVYSTRLVLGFQAAGDPRPASTTESKMPTPTDGPALTDFSSPSSEVASIKSATFIMNVSAYDIGPCCCGEDADGITASGVKAVGRICAAPPEYPFGTVFDVEGMGEYVCEDRGGAIKGNKLDLLFPTHGGALLFGRQYLKVKVRMEAK